MLQLYLFNSLHSLAPMANDDVLLVTPNPKLADLARVQTGINETITIANFVRSYLGKSWVDKKELQMTLLLAWEKFFHDRPPSDFDIVFNWITDFRSHTLDSNILSQVASELPADFAGPFQACYSFIEQLNLTDEHGAYVELTNELQEYGRPIWFWGFSHLSGTQLDFIIHLSRLTDVSICLPYDVYRASKDIDWVHWLVQSGAKLVEIESQEEISGVEIKATEVASGLWFELYEELGDGNYILGKKDLALEDCLQEAIPGVSYKIVLPLFESDFSFLKKKLSQLWIQSQGPSIPYVQLRDELDKLGKRNCSNLLKTVSKKYIEYFDQWLELSSDDAPKISKTVFHVISQIVEQALPRIYAQQGTVTDSKQISALKDLEQNSTGISYLILKNNFDLSSGQQDLWPEKVQSILLQVSPRKRAEIELAQMRSGLHKMIKETSFHVLIEAGVLERSPFWSSWLSQFQFSLNHFEPKRDRVEQFERVLIENQSIHKLDKFSPTSLQTYIDCPLRFKLKYLDRLRPQIDSDFDVSYSEMGIIEHKIIETYLQAYEQWDPNLHRELCHEVMASHIQTKDLSNQALAEIILDQEVMTLTRNGIQFLRSLQRLVGGGAFQFEVPLRSGQCDLLLQTDECLVLIDFKRSKNSIPTQTEIAEFSKIQLHYYLNSLTRFPAKILVGWLALKDIEDSLFYTRGINLEEISIKSNSFFDDDFFQRYGRFEDHLIKELDSISQYPARPRKSDMCNRCEFRAICSRGAN